MVSSMLVVTGVAMGCSKPDDASGIGPPTGTTGNEWTESDFAGSESRLAKEGGPEFVEFCRKAGSCKIEGEVLDKLKDVLAKYPVGSDEEYDHFSVVVREGLIKNGLLPEGDPERYQYQLSMLAIALKGP
jgi:hypothetical protein